MARRIGIVFFALIAVLGLIVGGLLVFATSETGSKFISDKLRNRMKTETGLDLSFANIDIDVFPPRIRVKAVKANDEKNRVVCTVEEAEFAPRPLDLLKGELGIEEVYVGSPRCTISLISEDIDYLEKASQKKSKTSGSKELDLSKLPGFDVFAMSSAEIILDIHDDGRLGNLHAVIKGLGLDVTGGESGIEVRGLVESADAKWENQGERIEETLDEFSFRTAVTPTAIDVRHLNLLAAGAIIQARKAHIPIPFGKKMSDIADVSLAIPLDIINRMPIEAPQLVGNAGFIGRLSFKENAEGKFDVTAEGKVSLDQGRVDDFVIGDIRGQISYSPQGVVFTDTEVITADGSVNLNGNVAFDEKLTTQVDANLNGIELGLLLEQLTVSGSYVTQKTYGPAKLRGTLSPFRLKGTIDFEVLDHTVLLDSFRAKNPDVALYVPKVLVKGPVNITDRFIDVGTVAVHSGSTDLAVDMKINFGDGTWRLYAKSKDLHLKDVKKVVGFDVDGHGPVTCLITGFLWDPKIAGSIAIDKLVFDGFDFDKGATDVHFFDNILAFSGMSLIRKQSKASISELLIDFGLRRGMKISTKIESEGVKIKDLQELFALDTKSYGSPQGELFGRVAIDYYTKPERLRVDASMLHDNLVVYDETFGPGSIKLNWDEGELAVSQFDVTKGSGTGSITGTMRRDGSIAFMAVATDIDTTIIDNPIVKDLGIATIGQGFAVVEGTTDHPTGFADIQLGDLVHRNVKYGKSDLKLELDGNVLSAKGKLIGESAVLEHSSLNIATNKFEVEAFVSDFDVVPIFDIDTYGNKASLRITGDAALKGVLDKKLNLSGHATMSKVKMLLGEVELENKKPLKIVAKRSQFQIGRTRFGGPDVVFDIKGVLGLERLNLDVKGLADLGSASTLISGINKSEGVLNFKIQARGIYGAPTLRGTADLEDGMIVVEGFPHRIERIRGKALLSPQLIQFNNFTASCAEGNLTGNGELRLQEGEISDYQFRVKAEDLDLRLVDDVSFTASTIKGGLILRAPKKGGLPTVGGDVEISNLRYTQDIRMFELSDLNIERLSRERRRVSRPRIFDESKNVFEYDINLHGKRNLKARNNIFDVELAIDNIEKPLRIVGTNQTFGFLGRALGRPGEIRFAGKRFDIKYASIDFQDKLRPENPNFYVTADGQVRDWRITLTAEGTADEYDIKLASQPYLPQEDIIFVILTGLTRTEHNQFGGTGISLGAPILGQLGPGGGPIPLELSVYKEYSEKADADTTRLKLGKWLTPNIWFSFSSSIGEESDMEAELDYRINDKLSLAAGYENDNEGNVGNVGMDLKFRLEF